MNNNLNYSDFILSSEAIKNKQEYNNAQNNRRIHLIDKHVTENGLIKLKSAYLGTDSYYYDKKTKIMYKVCYVCHWNRNENPTFEISNDANILRLNSLI
jgi:hypothetical protein